MLSPDGRCHSFDDRANGYVRADAIGAILLEADSVASNGIMRILGTGANSDGSKKNGITYPDSNQQIALCRRVCSEYNIDASQVSYVEAHGTGTVAGDGQELRAIDTVYGSASGTLIGSVKSNMGHAEGGSGIMSLIKVLGIMNDRVIPTNLHYQGSTVHAPIMEHRLNVVDSTRAAPEGLIAVNNFGFGGTNAHVVAAPGGIPVVDTDAKARFIFGRTKEAVEMYHATGDLNAAAWAKLMRSSATTNKFPWRGVVNEHNDLSVSEVSGTPKLAFCYSGQGCQWAGMASDLWAENAIFRETVTDACSGLDIDINGLFATGEKWMDKAWSGLGITLVQIGLTAILQAAGVVPDYIFGHSVGEVACGYADGCTSAQEAARIAYIRCQLSDKIHSDGLMAAVGLSFEEASDVIKAYPNTVIACYNSFDGVTLSGATDEIHAIIAELTKNKIFAKIVPTDGIAYHSIFFKKNEAAICDILKTVITDEPVERSERWLSTSSNSPRKYPDAEYHTANITGMVNFAPVVSSLPTGTVILEIGPHALLKSIIRRGRENGATILGVILKGTSGVTCVNKAIDDLWLNGISFDFPKVNYTVPLAKRIKFLWDHEADWRVANYKDYQKTASTTVTYDLAGKDAYLMDHVIDGRSLFPATGHIFTAWQAYGTDALHFTNVKILSAIIMDGFSVTFTVKANEKEWSILHDGNVVAQGNVAPLPEQNPHFAEVVFSSEDVIEKPYIYSTFARYGYEYKPAFQLLRSRTMSGTLVTTEHTQHWIPYLDNILQAFLKSPKGLFLPTSIESIYVACKDVEQVCACPLIGNDNLQTFGNKFVSIRGLKTTASRKFHKTPTLNGVEFVPYGEHVFQNEEKTKQRVIQRLHQFVSKLYTDDACVSESIRKFYSAVPSLCDASSEVDSDVSNPLVAILQDSLSQHRMAFLSNAPAVIKQHSSFHDLLLSDPILSFKGCDTCLNLMTQVVRENIGREYSVLEVPGVYSIGKSLYPIIQPDISSYRYAGEKANAPHPRVQMVAHDINSTFDEHVDLFVASSSFNEANNISESLQNVRESLNDGGFLLIQEHVGLFPLLFWGVSESTNFTDQREFGRWMSKNGWLKLLSDNGFEPIVWFVDESSTQLTLLARKSASLENEVLITGRSGVAADTPAVLNTTDYGYLGMVRCLRKEPGFEKTRLNLDITRHAAEPKRKPNLPLSVTCDGKLGGMHEVPLRMRKTVDRGYHVDVPIPGDLSSLRWVENMSTPNCDVEYCGVNFKDVMLALGKLTSPEQSIKIGLEFTGTCNGQPVMGIASGCLATRLRAEEHLMWPLPPTLSLEEACTIPVVYSTVYYALVCRANIQPGQTVLIHSIAGGVGQAAYHVCKFRDVNVIGTCSTNKMDWVHENLGLDKRNILDSHSLLFRDGVMELTDGRGVDVVLNSLAGNKLQAGLQCVAPYGHFVEIGKYDIQQNMLIGLGVFERNISIHGFDLSDMFTKPSLWKPIQNLVRDGLVSGEIVPLKTTVFDEVEAALRCMSAGKHIGKVLVRTQVAAKSLATSPLTRRFTTHGTHVVVGGLGGFGLELVGYLWAKGAEKVIVVSRSNPKPHQKLILQNGIVSHVNLKDYDACDAFIAQLGSSLVGVWHLGMVLNDRLYANMTDEAWNETVDVKALISRNLDMATRKHSPALEHFVLWSSVSSLFGNPGQTNYGYANAVMEHVCMTRKEDRLPGLAVQWGFIDNVGVMMNKAANASLTFAPQHIDSCLESLNTLLYSDHAIATSYIRKSAETVDEGASTLTISQRVARVLGLDVNKINSSDVLASLGMDSLQSVEVTNLLKAAGLDRQITDLKMTTWAQILSFD